MIDTGVCGEYSEFISFEPPLDDGMVAHPKGRTTVPNWTYHVFLSHASADKPAVEELARRLKAERIEPWLDKWSLIPGDAWQPAIEQALADCATCAVFIGPGGFGAWQNEEMRAAIDRRVGDSGRQFRVIPVLLPGVERPERGKLPSFLVATTWVEFRNSLDDADAFRRLVCGIRGIEPGAGANGAAFEGQNPYRGLELFDVEHAPLFFGREALTEWLIDALRRKPSGAENRFLAIVGASGSGKSSLARAGLVPALRRGELEGSAEWPVTVFRPGADPLESLAVALAKIDGSLASPVVLQELMATFRADERTLHQTARLALRDAPPTRRLVVVVDQFEEVFTVCPDEPARAALIANLLYAANASGGQAIVILTMRADFYGKCASYPALAAAMSDHQVLVGPMTEDELRRSIERPAQLVGLEFEPGLVGALIRDVKDQVGGLPLLQYALLELWKRRDGRRLTADAYRAIGGLQGALENRANEVLHGLSPAERELCRRIFLRLTQPGEGTEDTKRRAAYRELRPTEADAPAVDAVVRKLADARLITTEGKEEGSVEVAHEALIRGWSELRKWIDADRAGLRTHRRLAEAARDYDAASIEARRDFLYSGASLVVASEWAAANKDRLNSSERAFLQASQQAKRDLMWKDAMRRFLIVCLLAALVPALVFGGVAWRNAQQAREAEQLAREAESKAASSESKARDRARVAELATTDLLEMYRKPCDLIGRIATAETPRDAQAVLSELLGSPSVTDETIRGRLNGLQVSLEEALKEPVTATGDGRPTYRFENDDVLSGLLGMTRAYAAAWIRRREALRERDPALADEVVRLQYMIMLRPVLERASTVIRDFDARRGYEESRDAIRTFWSLYYGDSYLIESLGTTDRTRELGKQLERHMVELKESLEEWRSRGQPPREFPDRIRQVGETLEEIRRELKPGSPDVRSPV